MRSETDLEHRLFMELHLKLGRIICYHTMLNIIILCFTFIQQLQSQNLTKLQLSLNNRNK